MKISEIAGAIERFAPLILQESYDNAGLLIGSPSDEVACALITLDVTEEVIDEAIQQNCKLIIAHHPLIFKGIKTIGTKNPVERMITRCIKNDIAVYAAHTNLDNVHQGVNKMICEKIGLKETSILDPKAHLLRKLVTFCPEEHANQVREALFKAGAGHIGKYDNCSFNTGGQGTFRALEGANPFVGIVNSLHAENEVRIETVFPIYQQSVILKALIESHPYEEVAFDLYPLENEFSKVGSGMFGILEQPEETASFLMRLKETFEVKCLRHTRLINDKVQTVAVCGGSGSFLMGHAIARHADVFITGDVKYHEFFDADGKILLADIGHFESEQFTTEVIKNILLEKFPTFAARISKIKTNPVFYL
ncbi:MAG: Nif3-like dinuclear metal center hexameric protein [Bacteroidales bacterium]|nr:Nif3-like dinuclear metal center hexameric protein [Bacteroidales bacterium]